MALKILTGQIVPGAGNRRIGVATIDFESHAVTGDATGGSLRTIGSGRYTSLPGFHIALRDFVAQDRRIGREDRTEQDRFRVDTRNFSSDRIEVAWGCEPGAEIREISYLIIGEVVGHEMGMRIISVKDYGARGDGMPSSADQDTAAFIRAIEEARGRPIRIPAGTYFINRSLVYETSDPAAAPAPGLTLFGEGMHNTTLVTLVADGPLLRLQGGENTGTRQQGGRIADFSIVSNAGHESDSGIEFRSVWHCDVERIRIQGLGGSGIHVISNEPGRGDNDSSAFLHFNNCVFTHNHEYGMHFDSAEGTLGISEISIENCDIFGNGLGGIRGNGVGIFRVQCCAIVSNGMRRDETTYGGIHIGYSNMNSQVIVIEECEIGNNNLPYSICLEGCVVGEISRNRFVKAGFERDKKGIVIGSPGPVPPDTPYGYVIELACRQDWFVIEHSGTPLGEDVIYTAFEVTSFSRNLNIEKTHWSDSFRNYPTKFIKLNDEGGGTVMDDRPWDYS